jgi:pimeloyl-ACP methyl ester carboxylesterase
MSDSRGPGQRGLDWIASRVDRAVERMAISRGESARARSRAEGLGPRERATALRSLADHYHDERWLSSPELFFPGPTAASIETTRVRSLEGGEVRDLSWESGYAPFADEVAALHLREEANRRAHARAFVHTDRRRPAVLFLHGYLGGWHAMEERVWPLSWFYEKGFDAYLTVLPMHGARADGPRPKFPSSDPRLTIEGFRQAVHDLRSLVTHVLDEGAPAVGAIGMSLGGYTASLLATVEPRLSFVVPFVPLASIADFAAESERFNGVRSQRAEQHALLERVYRVVSPLSRPVLVPKEGRLVIGAHGDRITPPSHAKRLAAHFDSELVLFSGGHLLQVGRAEGFRAVGRMLGRLGLFERT